MSDEPKAAVLPLGAEVEGYLGFFPGDVVMDATEIGVGTAKIKRIVLTPCDWAHGPTAMAVMENGAERLVVGLKKVRPHAHGGGAPKDTNVVSLSRRQ